MSLSVWNRVSTEVIFDLTSKQITKITTHKIGRKEQTEFDLEKVSRIFVKDGKRNYLEFESLGGETFILAWGEVDDLDELVSTIEEFLNKPSN